MLKNRALNKIRNAISPAKNVPGKTATLSNKPEISFNGKQYLDDHQDIHAAVIAGQFSDAADHYARFGVAEGRQPPHENSQIPGSVDSVFITVDGKLFVLGWLNDKHLSFEKIEIQIGYICISIKKENIYRYIRPDVSQHLKAKSPNYPYAFFGLLDLGCSFIPVAKADAKIISHSGTYVCTAKVETLSVSEFLAVFLSFYGGRQTVGNIAAASLGEWRNNLSITVQNLWDEVRAEVASVYELTVIGTTPGQIKNSFILVLYKDSKFLAAQCASIFGKMTPDEYELIIVCNSPELAQKVTNEIRMANLLYGVSGTIIWFPGNTGFANANNIAAEIAIGERLVFINPDIFPCGSDWAKALECSHKEAEYADILGAALFYGDGALMHGGMDIKIESFPAMPGRSDYCRDVLWVDHFWKGGPPALLDDAGVRFVPAVTGAFMSVSRGFFSDMAGFSDEFVYAHYEDADFCLRVWQAGGRVIFDPRVRLFHFEGQGSGPGYVGANGMKLVNRCVFSERWGEKYDDIRQIVFGDSVDPIEDESVSSSQAFHYVRP